MPESLQTAYKTLLNYIDVTAPNICNIGSALTDNLSKSELALHCFVRAIQIESQLVPPKQNIWVACRRYVVDCFRTGKYNAAMSAMNRAEEYGIQDGGDALYYFMRGLTAECINQTNDALWAYKMALEYDQNFILASLRLDEINGTSHDFGPWGGVQRVIEDNAFNNYFPENCYSWN